MMYLWALTGLATGLGLVSMWLYGNRSRLAAPLSVVSCLVWLWYVSISGELPLLVSVIANLAVAIRNWRHFNTGLVR